MGAANEHRRATAERRHSSPTSAEDRALTRFMLADLFVEPEIRRRTIVAPLMSIASATGFGAISTWVPAYVGSVAAKAGLAAPQWARPLSERDGQVANLARTWKCIKKYRRHVSLGVMPNQIGQDHGLPA